MKLFRYLGDKRGIAETYNIYKAVQNLKGYAISKYKNRWEDALDEAFFHILENYDSSKGDLENYATKIVGTIYLNSCRKEVASSDKTEILLNSQEAEEYVMPEEVLYDDHKSTSLNSCIVDIIPYFVKDFKFFISSCSKDRKLNYKEIFEKYTYSTVSEAKEYLVRKYTDKVERLVFFSKNVTIKDFSDDRYLKSTDTGLEYKGVLNEIVMVKKSKGSHAKKLYRVSMRELVDLIVSLFYTSEEFGKAIIEDIDVFITISGHVVMGESNLRNCLERELVGSILSRTSLKVVNYIKGSEILLSSTKDIQYDISLPMFGKDLVVSFNRVVSKEVS